MVIHRIQISRIHIYSGLVEILHSLELKHQSDNATNNTPELPEASLCCMSLSATYLEGPVRSIVTRILSIKSKMSVTNKPLTQKHVHSRQWAWHQQSSQC